MILRPALSARGMIATDSSWSVLPQAPNIIAPRQRGLTFTPVLPRVRCSMAPRLAGADHPAPCSRICNGKERSPIAPLTSTCDHTTLDMSTSGYPEAPPASDVAFDVE